MTPAQRLLLLESAFTPLSIPGLAVWYDASDLSTLFQDDAFATPVTTDAQAVGGWRDKSGSGRHLAQADTAKQSIYKVGQIASRPVVEIAHTADVYPPAATLPLTGAFTFYGVGKRASNSIWPVGGGTVVGTKSGMEWHSNTSNYFGNDASGAVSSSSKNPIGSVLFTMRRTSANEVSASFTGTAEYALGTLAGTCTIGLDAGSGFLAWDGPAVGNQYGELLIYTADLVAAGKHLLVMDYLRRRWGASL